MKNVKITLWILAGTAVVLLCVALWFFLGQPGRNLSANVDALPQVDRGSEAVAPSSMENINEIHPLAAWGFEFPQAGSMQAFSFEVEGLDGSIYKLEDYRGNPLLLNFWATWCPPCREEIPSMERMMESLDGTGVSLLAISAGESREDVQAFVSSQNMQLKVALDEAGAVSSLYGIASIPTTYLIDGEGSFIARKTGGMEWDDPALLEILAALE